MQSLGIWQAFNQACAIVYEVTGSPSLQVDLLSIVEELHVSFSMANVAGGTLPQ